MLIYKEEHWFVDCDGENCKAKLPFIYVNKQSALCEIADNDWEIHENNKCYCPKCVKKESK